MLVINYLVYDLPLHLMSVATLFELSRDVIVNKGGQTTKNARGAKKTCYKFVYSR